MIAVADNDYYGLNYDEAGNCIYWMMKGFWNDMSVAPDFHKDWDRARELTRPGWKIFSDASKCKAIPPDVREQKVKNQEKSLQKGCEKIALIFDSAITKMSIDNSINKSGMDTIIKEFDSSRKDEAWEWLNS